MRLRPLLLVSLFLAAATTLSDGSANAQTTTTTITFNAVSNYNSYFVDISSYHYLAITGVQAGASASSTVVVYPVTSAGTTATSELFNSCERELLVAINRPGRVSLTTTLSTAATVPSTGNAGTFGITGCALAQLP
jgi:hypothetical protein